MVADWRRWRVEQSLSGLTEVLSCRDDNWGLLYLNLYSRNNAFSAFLLRKLVILATTPVIDFYFRKKHNICPNECKVMKSQSEGWEEFLILYIVGSYMNLGKQLVFYIIMHTDKHSLIEWMCPKHLQASKITNLLLEETFRYLTEVFMLEYKLWIKTEI